MSAKLPRTFELNGITLPLTAIQPIREIKATDAAFGKYRIMLASIREIGVIEPLMVYPQSGARGRYLLMDGHMRLKALQELGRTEAFCLVTTEEEAFTFNDKINRISLIQEHAMIMRTIGRGVTPEQIAKALDLDLAKIRASMNLLNGIHPDAVELLKDKHISAPALRLFRKVHAVRQIDMAQMMISANNYTLAFAEAMIVGTTAEQFSGGTKTKAVKGLSHEEIVRMEKEMETLERDYRAHQEQFGENSLHLNAAQRHVKRLLENTKVKRFLTTRYPELFDEFQELAALEVL